MRKRILAILLTMTILISSTGLIAAAAVPEEMQPYASDYLSSYNTYVCDMGGGSLQIWYSVMGTGAMEDIGTLSIKLYESTDKVNWTRVKTFTHENYSSMLGHNTGFHSSYVSYQGIAGRYYKAYVCIWAGKNGGGDTRYMWTSVEPTSTGG